MFDGARHPRSGGRLQSYIAAAGTLALLLNAYAAWSAAELDTAAVELLLREASAAADGRRGLQEATARAATVRPADPERADQHARRDPRGIAAHPDAASSRRPTATERTPAPQPRATLPAASAVDHAPRPEAADVGVAHGSQSRPLSRDAAAAASKGSRGTKAASRSKRGDWRLRTSWYDKHFPAQRQPPERFLSTSELDEKLALLSSNAEQAVQVPSRLSSELVQQTQSAVGEAADAAEVGHAGWREKDRWWRAASAAQDLEWECQLLRTTYNIDSQRSPQEALPPALHARWELIKCTDNPPAQTAVGRQDGQPAARV